MYFFIETFTLLPRSETEPKISPRYAYRQKCAMMGKVIYTLFFFFSHWFSILFSFLVGGKKKKKPTSTGEKKVFTKEMDGLL